MDILAERIRSAREEAGLSQAEVAKSLRVSASAVNQWEQGLSKNIKLDHFFALARLLRQDPQWLATGTVFPYMRHKQATPPRLDEPPLTREEKALLHHFRHLPDGVRRVFLKFIRGLDTGYVSADDSGRRG